MSGIPALPDWRKGTLDPGGGWWAAVPLPPTSYRLLAPLLVLPTFPSWGGGGYIGIGPLRPAAHRRPGSTAPL